jgi:alpha-methylacyl-CoA racemase
MRIPGVGTAGGTAPVSGPLTGLRVVEVAGIGPAAFAGMVLADLGADVLRLERVPSAGVRGVATSTEILSRGRRSVGIDLKGPNAAEIVLRLVERADALIEGFRPGVAERLGFGPTDALARNPRLVYGRLTGWGQSGPLAHEPGHDINYIALSGVLYHVGRPSTPPTPPLALVGDFGGGGMLLALGVVSALFETSRSGAGQVIDAAMVDGSALLATAFHSGLLDGPRGETFANGASHFYDVYETSDGRYVSVGALEPAFYKNLVERLGLSVEEVPQSFEPSDWPRLKDRLAAVFRTKTRDEWTDIMAGAEACFAPVLQVDEAPRHPHNTARGTFVEIDGRVQPAPAPRFSRTPPGLPAKPPRAGEHTVTVLLEWGCPEADVLRWRADGDLEEGDG